MIILSIRTAGSTVCESELKNDTSIVVVSYSDDEDEARTNLEWMETDFLE